MAIITLPDHELTTSAARRSKTWMKRLERVDTSASDGYAFVGPFANFGQTVECPDGTHFLGYVEDVRSSGRMDGRDVTLYRVTGGELVKVEHWYLDAARGWALKVRDQIAALIATPAAPDADALRAERAELLARLTEIDATLATLEA